jgi:hypothetical protein
MARKKSQRRELVEKVYEAYIARGALDPPMSELHGALKGQLSPGEVDRYLYLIRREKAAEETALGKKMRKLMPRLYGFDR